MVTTDPIILSNLFAEVALRQLPCGGWAALRSSAQPAIEPSCYCALALSSAVSTSHAERAFEFLLQSQNQNGSWPVFAGDDQEGAWTTALVLITLRDLPAAIPARLKGFGWLMNFAGRESNWLWNWKFRTADRHVRFDPEKFGWPWFPDTVSWVVPTAFALLALKQLPCSCGGFEQAPFRIERGIEMLLDRACPGGGWNAGNGVVYGAPVAPHPDDTAIALMALTEHREEIVVQSALQYLEQAAADLNAPWSLAWAILALAAYGQDTKSLQRRLASMHDLQAIEDTSTLALALLALDQDRALFDLGVK
jgi:hypothetical protein